MWNIFLNYFDSIFSLESFLIEINFFGHVITKSNQDELKLILKHLSAIKITFDFKFKGPFKSQIDTRYSYEQLLLLCYLKINESRDQFDNHMLITSQNVWNNNYQLTLKNLSLSPNELENRLMSVENLSLCYFLSRKPNSDGVYWRKLHSIIGSSIMKYLILYAFIFRRLDNYKNTHIQISGIKFSYVYKIHVIKKLSEDESRTTINLDHSNHMKKIINLKTVFEKQNLKLLENIECKKSASFQLKKLGHCSLNKTIMLYSKDLG